jgi:hypothetical protein
MTDQANNPDFRDAAKKSEAANIADESASYTNAIDRASEVGSDEPRPAGRPPEATDDE